MRGKKKKKRSELLLLQLPSSFLACPPVVIWSLFCSSTWTLQNWLQQTVHQGDDADRHLEYPSQMPEALTKQQCFTPWNWEHVDNDHSVQQRPSLQPNVSWAIKTKNSEYPYDYEWDSPVSHWISGQSPLQQGGVMKNCDQAVDSFLEFAWLI